jgi:hypothetical protein
MNVNAKINNGNGGFSGAAVQNPSAIAATPTNVATYLIRPSEKLGSVINSFVRLSF